MSVTVRDAAPADEARWRALWDGYCRFYETDVPAEVTAGSWARILDPETPIRCLVAERNGEIVGFANYVVHPYTWSLRPAGYLEDLFVDPAARATGIGRALIDALVARMKAEGWGRLYWHTQESNARARMLYDSYGPHSGYVRYAVPNPEI